MILDILLGLSSNVNLRLEDQLRSSYASSNQLYDFVETEAKNYKEIADNHFEQKARNRRDVNEVAKEKVRNTITGTLF